VHVLGRRGPAQATWTTKELRELGELEGVDVEVDAEDLELEPVSAALVESDRVVARNVEVIRGWADHHATEASRHIHLHFHARPVELLGTDRVEQVVVERTTIDESGQAHGTGETYELDAQLVVRSVGYRGEALAGVPFDDRRNVIPNVEGRVVDEAGTPIPGLYVAGWIKRGPTGIIGTNKKDAAATVASLLADLDGRPAAGAGIGDVLAERGVQVVDLEGWRAIDAAERALGAERGRDRTTLHERDTLVAAARG
jgi:ferredoxin--NADP+ reductase